MKKQRELTMKNSPQLRLGELIKEIEKIGILQDNEKPKSVVYSFGYMVPTDLDSWRGSYNELAIGYSESNGEMKADIFLQMLKNAIGKSYDGYKGGEFEMNENTPIWVANYGNSGNTGIIGILDKGYEIILITGYCKY